MTRKLASSDAEAACRKSDLREYRATGTAKAQILPFFLHRCGNGGGQTGFLWETGPVSERHREGDQPTPAVTFSVHNSSAHAGQAYQRGDRMRIHRGAPLNCPTLFRQQR